MSRYLIIDKEKIQTIARWQAISQIVGILSEEETLEKSTEIFREGYDIGVEMGRYDTYDFKHAKTELHKLL